MVQYAFDSRGFEAQYGGGAKNLPVGRYKGMIVDTRQENTAKGGGMLVLDIAVIDGPLKDQIQTDRLNLLHPNPTTVKIANQQLSAYCAVTGVLMFNDTSELHLKPFQFEVGWQRGQEPVPGGGVDANGKPDGSDKPGGYTEIKALADMNGNAPGKQGAAAAPANHQPPPPAPAPAPAAQVQPQAQAGGWNQAPATAPAPAAAHAAGGWNQQPR